MIEFRSLLEPEKYLTHVKNIKHKLFLTIFRCSVHKLAVEVGRHKNVELENILCNYCLNHSKYYVEDECNFVFVRCMSYYLLNYCLTI